MHRIAWRDAELQIPRTRFDSLPLRFMTHDDHDGTAVSIRESMLRQRVCEVAMMLDGAIRAFQIAENSLLMVRDALNGTFVTMGYKPTQEEMRDAVKRLKAAAGVGAASQNGHADLKIITGE